MGKKVLKTLSTKLPEDYYEILSRLSAEKGIRISFIVKTALWEYLERNNLIEPLNRDSPNSPDPA